MIDTITIKIEPPLPAKDVFKETITASGIRFNSKIRNLDIMTCSDFTIVKGSLPKFMHGSNIKTLPFSEVKSTIQKLSELFDRDISNAQILGIDWSTTITTKNKPVVYYSILGETYPYQRIPFKNSLYYNTNTKKLLFYDKGKEAKTTGNLLRNEVRWTNLKKDDLRFNHLTKPEIFTSFTHQWLDVFLSINKIRKPMPKQISNHKDFDRYLKSVAIELLGGRDGVFEIVNNLQRNGDIAYHHKRRIKNSITNLIKNIGYPSVMEDELTRKFTEVANQNYH